MIFITLVIVFGILVWIGMFTYIWHEFWTALFLVLFFFSLGCFVLELMEQQHKATDSLYKNGPILEMDMPNIGCKKYRYYNDVLYKCNDKSIVNQLSSRN